jgi:hypothetical protein
MPGTLSANGTWQMRMLETGSSTAYGTTAIPAYINFFDQLQQSRTGGINTTYELGTEFNLNSIPIGNYYFQIRQSPNFPSSVASLPLVTLDPQASTKSFLEIRQVNSAADGRVMDIPSNMPYGTTGIKQIDFITGLQKKFNLVIYPNKTKANEFIIETFNNWYKKGEIRDFNKYINLDETIEVISANNLAVNKLNFLDSLDTDYISQQFSKAANREYGKTYYVDTTNFYSQGEFNVKTTFASDPLIRIAGTGLSGSVSGINPPVTEYFAGSCKVSYSGDSLSTCYSAAIFDVYTDTGRIQTGLILYTDQYGANPLIGYRWIVDPSSNEIYDLNATTGEIGYGSGDFC